MTEDSSKFLMEALPKREAFDALAFMQISGEYRVACLQTYQLARYILREKISSEVFSSPCVVLDLDETVLDNSRFQAWLVTSEKSFSPDDWDAWCNASEAIALPGVIGFLRYARESGVTPVFITSRSKETRDSTVQNLVSIGAIHEDERSRYQSEDYRETLLFMDGMEPFKSAILEDKFEQRQFLERIRGFEICLSLGDNLGDYAPYYKKLITKLPETESDAPELRRARPFERRASVDQDDSQWGDDFLILPNPTYGDWKQSMREQSITRTEITSLPNPILTDTLPAWKGPSGER